MSYFDDASLVMIPSGYKTSKVYSVKPTSGDGDLTFTRSNDTATRVGPDGLIEKVRTNLALQSNTFSSASWTKFGGVTVTSGQAGYDGTNNAWLITKPAAAFTGVGQAHSNTGVITGSFYLKAGTFTKATVRLIGTPDVNVIFDLANGVIFGGTSTGWLARTITSVGNGWYRCSLALNATASSLFIVYPDEITNTTAGTIFAQNAQLETGDIATQPILTTSAAVSVGPVANVPRLDYLNSSCPRLLLEPQRTNLRTSSEQFSSLSPSNVTVTSNDTTSPDGYTNADKLTPIGSGFHTIGNSISVTAGQKYTISVFYKYGTHKNIGFYDNNTAGSEITINMETNAFTLGGSVEAGGVIPYGNGWYRAYATFTAGSSDMVNYIIFRDNTNNGNYTGDGSYSWFYGWQVELGAYATSYIPTLGAAVTRGADSSSITDLTGKGIIPSSAAYTAFFELELLGNEGVSDKIILSDATNFPRFVIYNEIAAVAGWPQVEVIGANAIVKFAFRANSTQNASFFKNGSLVNTFIDAGGGALTFERMILNGQNGAFKISQAILFPTALSDADCIALTA